MISKIAKKAAPLLALVMAVSLASAPSYGFAREKDDSPRTHPGNRGGDGGGNRGGGNRGGGGGRSDGGGSAPAPRSDNGGGGGWQGN
ncbi:hypothetical protein ABAC460_13840, partial [Asticcacaulis sp. AC460]|uniref:hypothetical protein n=1 Tax=Asticcacaulis sp. AC460 TaxID=1282360 RepID=UPI0003C3E02B